MMFDGSMSSATRRASPKHLQLSKVLEAELRQMEAGVSVPPVTALMTRFGVSQGTVVHALRNLRTKGVVARPPGRKRLVVLGRPGRPDAVLNVLLLRSPWSSPDYDAMNYALLEEANRQRLHLETLHATDKDREDLVRTLRSFDALLLMPSSTDPSHLLSAVEESGLPTVMLWEDPPSTAIFSVADENFRVGQSAVEFLLGLGHRRVVAFLSEPTQSSVRKKRLAGWEHALRSAGERHPKHFTINCSVEPGTEAIVGSYERLRRWLFQNGNRLPATSVFCLDWTGALGMLRALREVGIEVPRDVSILTHGGSNRLCEFTNPALSVIQSSTEDFAAEALGLLKSACLGDPTVERTVHLPANTIERESTAPPPK